MGSFGHTSLKRKISSKCIFNTTKETLKIFFSFIFCLFNNTLWRVGAKRLSNVVVVVYPNRFANVPGEIPEILIWNRAV
jgi:hypothetical protein